MIVDSRRAVVVCLCSVLVAGACICPTPRLEKGNDVPFLGGAPLGIESWCPPTGSRRLVDGARVSSGDLTFYVYVEGDEHDGLVSTLGDDCVGLARRNISADAAAAVRARVDASFHTPPADEPLRGRGSWACTVARWRPGHAESRVVFDGATSTAAQATRDACQALLDVSAGHQQLQLRGELRE